jgi:hypothetical protein
MRELNPAIRQDLDRRFAFGIRRLLRRSREAREAGEAAGGAIGSPGSGVGSPSSLGSPARSIASPVASPQPTAESPPAVGGLALDGRGGGDYTRSPGMSPMPVAAADADAGGSGALDASGREAEIANIVRRLRAYDQQLRKLGLRDSQIPTLERAPVGQTLFTLGHMLFMLTIALFPSMILNAPVGFAAVAWAKMRQRESLARSDVKLRAYDVVLSEKMKFAVVGVPLLWLLYAGALLTTTSLDVSDVITLVMLAPLASYVGVISVESGMIALRDLRPMLARLTYDKESVEALKAEHFSLRRHVVDEIKRLVESDSVVRELYHMRGELSTSDWERIRVEAKFSGGGGNGMRRSESMPGLSSSGSGTWNE